jgi:enoyl-CoA hydratase/carnithine racemase
MSLPESAAYDLAVDVMASTSQSADAQEGMRSFLEKRPPHWQEDLH